MADMLAALFDTSHLERWRYEMWRNADSAIQRRDIEGVLAALHLSRGHCFVWPETYARTYWYQRVADKHAEVHGLKDELHNLPVVMRGALTSLYAKYNGRAEWACRVVERYIAFHHVTVVDQPASIFLHELWGRVRRRHQANPTAACYFRLRENYSGAVLVHGKIVPLGRDKITTLERSLKIIEKIDKLIEKQVG